MAPYSPPSFSSYFSTPLIVFPITTFFLGTWQVYRLQWKRNLIQEAELASTLPPLDIESHLNAPPHTRVSISGESDANPPFLVGPRTREGKVGYNVISPFNLKNGERILVNFGWIPKSMRDTFLKTSSVTLSSLCYKCQGIIYPSKGLRPWFSLPNNLEKNDWIWCDIETMSRLAKTKPILVQIQQNLTAEETKAYEKKGHPIPSSPYFHYKNDHLGYALTWFSLTGVSTWLIYLKNKRKWRLK